MIYKYTKCESVIAKIMADADISEKNIRITDIREWIFEAVEKIGAPTQYVEKESGVDGVPIFRLHDGQIPIPDDLESLVTVAYSTSENGPWIPVRKNEQTFKSKYPVHKSKAIAIGHDHNPENYAINKDNSQTYIYETGEYHNHHIPHLPPVMPRITHRSRLLGINRDMAVNNVISNLYGAEPTYFVKPGWIVLNKRHGFVKLSYKAIATDERGYPLIPDLASYLEAIYWYVMMKLNFPKFLKGTLGGKARAGYNIYTYLLHQWNFYRGLAYAEALMPNEGEMRSIKNEWTKLIPDWDSDDNSFRSLGLRQININDYYYGY